MLLLSCIHTPKNKTTERQQAERMRQAQVLVEQAQAALAAELGLAKDVLVAGAERAGGACL
jgi:hypothetical protein